MQKVTGRMEYIIFRGFPMRRQSVLCLRKNINGRECTRLPGLEEKRFNPGPPSAENDRLTYSEEYGENCLSLDIYVPGEAPEKEEKKKLPVAVYIHGGAFQNGSSRDRSGPGMIRDHRFIYVSVNYRLGVLGYLYLGKALGKGTGIQVITVRWINWPRWDGSGKILKPSEGMPPG